MKSTLVIDQGTHASRAVLFSACGELVDQVEGPVDLIRINHECVEQNPQQILRSITDAADKLLARNSVPIGQAALATQRSTVLAWQKDNGRPLSPALSWQDRRARHDLKQFESRKEEIRRITGLPLSPHYGVGKLRWLLQHGERTQQALEADNLFFGPLVSYLLYHLLSGSPHLVDHSNAHRTLLFDIAELNWSEVLLDLFDVPARCLPQVRPIQSKWGLLSQYDIPLRCCKTISYRFQLFDV